MATPAAPSKTAAAAHDRCVLQHPVFTQFGEVSFRPAEADGTPVMIFPMGASTAAIPLHSLQLEFAIEPDSPDGQMLGLVARALDFVGEVRPSDPLPMEVLGGGASWQPGAPHVRIAEGRLRLQLAAAFDSVPAPAWATAEPQAVLHAMADPTLDARLQAAASRAAEALDTPGATAVANLLAAAAHEQGFVEALRDRLLRRVGVMLARVDALAATQGHNPGGTELLSRVRRLAGIAHDKMRARFAELETCTAAVVEVLRDLDGWGRVIRLHRDWLYGSLRAWEGLLTAWESGGLTWSQDTWALLRRSYRFLAPRFMPVQEWQLTICAHRADAAPREPMVW